MLQKLAITLIHMYRATLSQMCWGACRFYPTCSAYAIQALKPCFFLRCNLPG